MWPIDVILTVSRKANVTPFQVFLQVAVSQDPENGWNVANIMHRNWLINDQIDNNVLVFCEKVLECKKKRKR